MSQDWHELVSQPQFKVKSDRDIFVKMRDGVRIAADVYRPDADGKFPALLSMSPYSKDVQKLPIFEFPTDRELGNGGIEAGDSEYFVSRGYIHVIADARGTAKSEGAYRVFSMKEQEDGYDLVEWIAAQPWCNGKVGMLGMSYFAMIQYLVAAQNPPHLKAIFPLDGTTDMYRHWAYHGGIMQFSFVATWWDGSLVINKVDKCDLSDKELKPIVEDLMSNNKDIRSYPRLWATLLVPQKNPHLFDVLVHPHDGPFYWERSAYTKFDKIKIPSYLFSRWTAWPIHLPGAFSAYEGIKAPKKLMITIPESGVGFNRPWHENYDIVLRWYDHWLKGNDTGIMDEPPITIIIQGSNQYRYENEWPLARTEWTKFYLRDQGQLTTEIPGWNEKPDSFNNIPGLSQGAKVPSLRYTTPVLTGDMEVTGPVALYLQASISTGDTNWIAELNDIDAEGAEKRVTIGWLKASHREIDENKSRPYQPYHPHTRSVPIEPGKVYQYAVELRETSYLIKAGHRLQLVIKAQDAPWEGKTYVYRISNHLPSATETRHTIHHKPEYLSYLLLPVIPK